MNHNQAARRAVALKRLRAERVNLRGALHDLSQETSAAERYGEPPDIIDKEIEAHGVANQLHIIERHIQELENEK